MENPVDEIKKKIDIIDFIGSFITLKKAGRNFKANCPFHQEKTPSFVISPDRQIWHCFGACQEGGDIVKFLMKWENITFFEALKELAEKTGVALRNVKFEDIAWKKKEKYFTMNLYSTDFFQYVLKKTQFGVHGSDYLMKRDINPKISDLFQIGYAPQSWDSLRKFLKRKNYEEEEMLENGLLVKNDKGYYYDRFRGRIMFPIKDPRGNVIGFSGRILEGENEAKYINTPETPIYHKRETLFGINLAKEAIKKEQNVFVVEGEFDVISPYQHGLTNFVAIKGSALTYEQLMLLKRYTNRVTLALDTDMAGEDAVRRGIEEAERFEFDINIINFDFAKDPDEAIRKDKNKFNKALKSSLPIYDYLIQALQKKYPEDNPYHKKKISDEILPFIERIKNNIVQSHYIKKLALMLGVSESSVELMIRKLKFKKTKSQSLLINKRTAEHLQRDLLIQRYILSLLFQSENPKSVMESLFSILEESDFSQVSYQKIYHLLVENIKEKDTPFSISGYTQQLTDELQPVFDEVYLFASTDLSLDNENIEKLAYEVKKFALKRKIGEMLKTDLEQQEDKKKELSLFNSQLKEVEKKLMSL